MFVFGGNVKKTSELKSPILRKIHYVCYLCVHLYIQYIIYVAGLPMYSKRQQCMDNLYTLTISLCSINTIDPSRNCSLY